MGVNLILTVSVQYNPFLFEIHIELMGLLAKLLFV